MRDEKEERKKQAKSNKQTRQSNTAHPRQSLFLEKMSCLGWDSNPCHRVNGCFVTVKILTLEMYLAIIDCSMFIARTVVCSMSIALGDCGVPIAKATVC